LFTRWPAPGKAKTRLIPALGADGAAALHKRLTERMVGIVRAAGLPLEVRSTGAEAQAFRDWLGDDISVIDQGEGDLGERLARTAQTTPVLLLGADVPDVTPEHLTEAAALLARQPLVIGPAEDGGYWLLGLSAPMPQLFTGIAWGTETVFAETVARAASPPALLPMLADLDRPDDLVRWPGL
jgi:rSAM/selenodomain-associated transferase 1